MNDTKNCKLFKDLYPPYLTEELEVETIQWIEAHLKSCISCKKWTENYVEEIVSDDEYTNKILPIQQQELNVIKKARLFLMIGITIVFALALWISLWIVSLR